MTQILFKLRDKLTPNDILTTLDDVTKLVENIPTKLFPDDKSYADIYSVFVAHPVSSIIQSIAALPHVEYCELPPAVKT